MRISNEELIDILANLETKYVSVNRDSSHSYFGEYESSSKVGDKDYYVRFTVSIKTDVFYDYGTSFEEDVSITIDDIIIDDCFDDKAELTKQQINFIDQNVLTFYLETSYE